MRELFVNGVYVCYESDAELERLLSLQILSAQHRRCQARLEELDKKRRKTRQLHEPPSESCLAL